MQKTLILMQKIKNKNKKKRNKAEEGVVSSPQPVGMVATE